MGLPTKYSKKLSPEQIEELENEDSFLRGAAALDIFNEAVKETGVTIPRNYVWPKVNRSTVEKAQHAVFGLIGGVPAMALWAHQNPSDFYKMYSKLTDTTVQVGGGGNVTVVTQVPGSPLDDVQLGKGGFVQTIVNGAVPEDDDA